MLAPAHGLGLFSAGSIACVPWKLYEDGNAAKSPRTRMETVHADEPGQTGIWRQSDKPNQGLTIAIESLHTGLAPVFPGRQPIFFPKELGKIIGVRDPDSSTDLLDRVCCCKKHRSGVFQTDVPQAGCWRLSCFPSELFDHVAL